MEAPMDSWEERRGALTPGEAYRCWLFGEGLETGVEKLDGLGAGAGVERSGLEATGRLKSALPKKALPSKKKGFSKERVEAVLKSGGKLSRADLLLCRVRWFSDGVAIGSKGFVEGVFKGCRSHFGAKRKDGARKIREDAAGSLHALRELRLRSVD
jgi:hypothetical protein